MSNSLDFMNEIAYFYDKICEPCNNERINFLLKYLNNKSNFIDLSCSTGETIFKLNKNLNCKMTGIDFSEKMIEISKTKNFNNKSQFITLDMNLLSTLNTKYDVIYSNSINWNPKLELFINSLKQMVHCLSSKGIIILDLPYLEEIDLIKHSEYFHFKSYKNSVIEKFSKYLNVKDESATLFQSYSIFDFKARNEFRYSCYLDILKLKIKTINDILNDINLTIEEIFYNYDADCTKKFNYQLIIKRKSL